MIITIVSLLFSVKCTLTLPIILINNLQPIKSAEINNGNAYRHSIFTFEVQYNILTLEIYRFILIFGVLSAHYTSGFQHGSRDPPQRVLRKI